MKIEKERRDAEAAAEEKKKRPNPLGPIFGQLSARTLADFLKEDFEKHGGLLTPEAEALLRVTGRMPAGRKKPETPGGDQAQSG